MAERRYVCLSFAQREALLFVAVDGGPVTVEQIAEAIERPITEATMQRLERFGFAFRALGKPGWFTTTRGEKRAERHWNRGVRIAQEAERIADRREQFVARADSSEGKR